MRDLSLMYQNLFVVGRSVSCLLGVASGRGEREGKGGRDEPFIRHLEIALHLIRSFPQPRQDARPNCLIDREAEERLAWRFLLEGLLEGEETELIFYHLLGGRGVSEGKERERARGGRTLASNEQSLSSPKDLAAALTLATLSATSCSRNPIISSHSPLLTPPRPHLNSQALLQVQARRLLPPIILVVEISEHLDVILFDVDLEQSRGIGFGVDEAEKVAEGMGTFEVQQDGVDWLVERGGGGERGEEGRKRDV